MGTRKVELGTTGETVRENVARLRRDQGLSLSALADKLAATDRPLSRNMISEIERGARRADVDDLAALAYALGANPNTLLMPHTASGADDVSVTAAGTAPAASVWEWLRGTYPLESPTPAARLQFHLRARPTWLFTDQDVPVTYSADDDADMSGARRGGDATDTP
ncbi:helix-turn-helix domain-containing protein [Nocardia salmonicida]|uniref:helix-turn-helix domain-containing protein n=1 Tax=Nocardia salmonicida TaxID=53431 RepID=UPI0033C9EFD3